MIPFQPLTPSDFAILFAPVPEPIPASPPPLPIAPAGGTNNTLLIYAGAVTAVSAIAIGYLVYLNIQKSQEIEMLTQQKDEHTKSMPAIGAYNSSFVSNESNAHLSTSGNVTPNGIVQPTS